MKNIKRLLNELNYTKIRDLIDQMLDLRENGTIPERSEHIHGFSLNDELIFIKMGLDIHDYLDKIIWIPNENAYICYTDTIKDDIFHFKKYCEYNQVQEKDIIYGAFFIGSCSSELMFTMKLAYIFLISIDQYSKTLRDCIDIEISKIRIVDSIMDLKYSNFDQYFKEYQSDNNFVNYTGIMKFSENNYRKIYDYALQNPTADNNADYHDLMIYIHNEYYKKAEE